MSDNASEVGEDSGARGRPLGARPATERAPTTVGLNLNARDLVMAVVLFLGGGGGTLAGHVVTAGPSEELRRKVEEIDKKIDGLVLKSDGQRDALIELKTDTHARLDKYEARLSQLELDVHDIRASRH